MAGAAGFGFGAAATSLTTACVPCGFFGLNFGLGSGIESELRAGGCGAGTALGTTLDFDADAALEFDATETVLARFSSPESDSSDNDDALLGLLIKRFSFGDGFDLVTTGLALAVDGLIGDLDLIGRLLLASDCASLAGLDGCLDVSAPARALLVVTSFDLSGIP